MRNQRDGCPRLDHEGTLQARLAHRNAGIDTVRGMAILMVLLLHFGETYGIWDRGPLVYLVGKEWAWGLLGWGNFAVTMFFVVSGFLITTNTIERAGGLAQVDLRAFYARRFARIMPCLLLALAVIVPLGLLGVPAFKADGARPVYALLLGAVSVLGFFHNVLMQSFGYFDYCLNVYWSLSVEEVFYTGFPLVCRLLRRDWQIILPCLVLIGVAPGYRAHHAGNDIFYLYANLACFDAIAVGCLTALLARRWRPHGRLAFAMQAFGWAAVAAIWVRGFGGQHKAFSFTAMAVATGCIVLGSLGRANPQSRDPPISWLGRHSYELYLFHIIILAVMRDIVPGGTLTATWQIPWLVLFLGLSAGTAAAITVWVSEPANRLLRRRLLPARAAAAG